MKTKTYSEIFESMEKHDKMYDEQWKIVKGDMVFTRNPNLPLTTSETVFMSNTDILRQMSKDVLDKLAESFFEIDKHPTMKVYTAIEGLMVAVAFTCEELVTTDNPRTAHDIQKVIQSKFGGV